MLATKEWSYYQSVCDRSKREVRSRFTEGNLFSPPPPFSSPEPCSLQSTVHYSFDMAQQVHYPSNPLQPDPIYFLTPRKCALFGVCCEALPRQVTYLIDEASDAGKGANSIVSMLHHFFTVHSMGECDVHLHADNCVGQNKNNTVLQYLMWRTMVGLHRRVTLSFLIVGHTKFAPDWCFGLIKRQFRKINMSSLADIATVVDQSASVNVPQLVGTQEGQVLVPTYDWAGMLGTHFRKLPNIKKYHHFHFEATSPGVVQLRFTCDGQEERQTLLKPAAWHPDPSVLPAIIPAKGLPLERQWYLHNHIAEYCTEERRDLVCPRPLQPPPKKARATD